MGKAVYWWAYSGQSVASTRTGTRSGVMSSWCTAAAIRSPAARSPRKRWASFSQTAVRG
ncbi:hypothetical protein [Streptomyces sp. WAC 05379]|uniref:hypothetical protein n=1 Tax=Streptomyces sp. WAC 05379 TaxID=2203207 RepID=UPI00163C8A2B|nr:hypothetical protein [Streptomyces sp. WAC 05379]